MPTPKLSQEEIEVALNQLDEWALDSQKNSIYKEWRFNNFKTVVQFLNQVCELADTQDHHPEILTTYTNLRIRLWTHDADGISHKDFTLASAIDDLITSRFSQSVSN